MQSFRYPSSSTVIQLILLHSAYQYRIVPGHQLVSLGEEGGLDLTQLDVLCMLLTHHVCPGCKAIHDKRRGRRRHDNHRNRQLGGLAGDLPVKVFLQTALSSHAIEQVIQLGEYLLVGVDSEMFRHGGSQWRR
ncbi:hypothetical protein BDV59DRAFT_47678 [Aspergillus ambiguus]|uniref:uncharacterized protein n=1 Tax=Aspergillus ambiguus TaxID=176160 RepID=UPI003CCD6C9D